MGSFGLEDPCDYGMEEELERISLLRAGYVPRFCRTEDEYREWRAGIVDEGELRARRARGGRGSRRRRLVQGRPAAARGAHVTVVLLIAVVAVSLGMVAVVFVLALARVAAKPTPPACGPVGEATMPEAVTFRPRTVLPGLNSDVVRGGCVGAASTRPLFSVPFLLSDAAIRSRRCARPCATFPEPARRSTSRHRADATHDRGDVRDGTGDRVRPGARPLRRVTRPRRGRPTGGSGHGSAHDRARRRSTDVSRRAPALRVRAR